MKIARTILGTPMSFTANGDVAGAKFHIFKIVNGKYQTSRSSCDSGARPRLRPRPVCTLALR